MVLCDGVCALILAHKRFLIGKTPAFVTREWFTENDKHLDDDLVDRANILFDILNSADACPIIALGSGTSCSTLPRKRITRSRCAETSVTGSICRITCGSCSRRDASTMRSAAMPAVSTLRT